MRQRLFVWGLAIFLIGFFVRAISLDSVHQVVFDEVHFGKFISSYCCTHERFFDIHPPIGKLIIAAGAYVGGYAGEFSFDSIGQSYSDVPIQHIRLTVAFFGALLPLIIFILLLQVGVSLPLSFVGAFAVALDNALVVESRFILTDSILLTATFGAIACAFASIRSRVELHSWVYVLLAGVLSGVAVGTKFTGLIAGGLVLVMFVWETLKQSLPLTKGELGGVRRAQTSPNPSFVRRGRRFAWLLKILVVSFVAVSVYLLGWMLHFSLLTVAGTGDAWGVPTGYFWTDLFKIHEQMVSANYHLTATHPYGSSWWTWPLMVRSVFYWQGAGNEFIYFLGNPVVWWGSFLLFCFGAISLLVYYIRGKWQYARLLFSSGAWIFILGYCAAYIPLMRVPRVLFLYHYLTPLLFSLLFGIWYLDKVVPKNKKAFAIVASICIFIGFYFVSPLTYGTHLSDFWYKALFSLTSWR